MDRRRFQLLGATSLLTAALPGIAAAQDGQKPLRIIVPYGPGTGADITTRKIAELYTKRTNIPAIVENRPGNGAVVGVNALKMAPPDGKTIGVLVSANVAQPWLMKNLPFDIRNDFAPLTVMYSGPLVMTVSTALPVNTVAEFVQYAKARPGKLSYGTLGAGTTTHLAAQQLIQATGIEMIHVPYKGSNEIHTAVASGEVTTSFDNYISPKPLIDAGKLKLLGVTSARRLASLPQVPTLIEAGYPGVELRFWTGFAAPRGTPRDMVDRLATDLRAVLQLPEMRERIEQTGSEAGGGSPEELTSIIRRDYERFGAAIRAAGLKPE